MTHVIVGGGVAGTTAAEFIRKQNSDADIILISEEEHALYSRVLLPHYLRGDIERGRIFLKRPSWYEEQNIEWITGETVVALDTQNKHLELGSGREISFDTLLLATGAHPTLVSEDVRGVSYLRNLDDADHLKTLINELPKNARAGIFGGGFIACEYLNIFASYNIPITMAFRGPYMWSHTLCEQAGEIINEHLRKQGVELITQTPLKKILGEKHVEGFEINQGAHACSLLGIGIGVKPDLSWINKSGIKTNDGIVCDQFLQTSVPNIFASGDVCEFFDERFGTHVKMGNWMNAMSQGRTAANNMLGEQKAFDLVSSYAINILGLDVIFIGCVNRSKADQFSLFGSKEMGGVTEIFVKNNQIIGAILVNRNEDRPILTKLISQKAEPFLFDSLKQ